MPEPLGKLVAACLWFVLCTRPRGQQRDRAIHGRDVDIKNAGVAFEFEKVRPFQIGAHTCATGEQPAQSLERLGGVVSQILDLEAIFDALHSQPIVLSSPANTLDSAEKFQRLAVSLLNSHLLLDVSGRTSTQRRRENVQDLPSGRYTSSIPRLTHK